MRLAAPGFWLTRPGLWPRAVAALAGVVLLSPLVVLTAPVEPRLVQTLAHWLENRIPRAVLPEGARIDGIIVLGGATSRVRAALALAAELPHAAVVLSGPGKREAALARNVLGPTERLRIDRRATNTHENARFSQELIAPQADECWIIVTSALHMPRAIGAFAAVGFPVLPWPVVDTPPTAKALSAAVWHEVLGLIGYWALGRSANLFPARPNPCPLPTDAHMSTVAGAGHGHDR
jgi:uncharacterized SAM-binding protein YcdF (DUF218 family)